jgi:serine protease Do
MQTKQRFLALVFLASIVAVVLLFAVHQDGRTSPSSSPAPAAQPTTTAIAERPLRTLHDLNTAFVEISKEVNPTVVTVFTEKVLRVRQSMPPFFGGPFDDFFRDFFGDSGRNRAPRQREFRQRGLGSGVIVSKEGYILTNNHVIQGADTINVRLRDDLTLPAKVIGADPKTDIAVIKVKAKDLPVIKMGNSDSLQVGEWVLAIGSPLSPNLAHTVTSGIVSAKGRSNVGLAEYEDFIQTDAAINPGNSGGALINLDGELVGINCAIISESGGFQGIGFAVPINMARSVMESLIKTGHVVRGYLGVYIQDIDQTMAKAMKLSSQGGALISDVAKDSPAENAGLKQGDVIIELNGKPVKNTTELRNNIAETAPGTKVQLKVLREGKEKTIPVKLGKLKSEQLAEGATEKMEQTLGFRIAPFDGQMAGKYQLDRNLKGVVITAIDQSSRAYEAGLNEGDLIIAVNRSHIESMEDFSKAVSGLKHGDTLLLQVIRQNRNFFAAFTL